MARNTNDNSTGLRVVTLDELKKQMRVEDDYDNSIITSYGKAAEQYVINDTRHSLAELNIRGYEETQGTTPSSDPGVQYFPDMLKVAILLLAANLYRNREPVAAGVTPAAVPYTLESLVKPYVRLVRDDNSE